MTYCTILYQFKLLVITLFASSIVGAHFCFSRDSALNAYLKQTNSRSLLTTTNRHSRLSQVKSKEDV